MNRLAQQSSPYLLQHQDNPVWWQPWDQQALDQAQRENKPIFLSIGYSTCHWCHVMAHESFENAEVAEVLNRYFVCIKVDREERPDLDDIYMTAVQQMVGHGGWPMSVWLSPQLTPFFGGTYFPQRQFKALLEKIHDVWTAEPRSLIQDGQKMLQVIRNVSALHQSNGTEKLSEEIFRTFVGDCERAFEPQFGGFSDAPKFPPAMTLMALMRASQRLSVDGPQFWIRRTLDGMSCGGIFDHLMGGFHRYSTDQEWKVPHFEKMLYDNALLSLCYLEASQFFKNSGDAEVARKTLNYLLQEMTNSKGGFYSAQDADSLNTRSRQKEEGYFATFTLAELDAILTSDEVQAMLQRFEILAEGNFEGRNVLSLRPGFAASDEPSEILRSALAKMRQLRGARPAPHLDDKVIAEWNGYAIAAFARGFQVLKETRYLQAAQTAARFILDNLFTNECKRIWRSGQTSQTAFAEDLAAVIFGLLHLYESDFDPHWYEQAVRLQKILDQNYWDSEDGGYFRDDGHQLGVLVRVKDDYDGVTPTANSLAALNLLKLFALSGNEDYRKRAESILTLYLPTLEKAPQALAQMLIALDFFFGPVDEIAIVGPEALNDDVGFLPAVRSGWHPRQVVAAAQSSAGSPLPLVAHREPQMGQTAAYVCHNQTCLKPFTRVEDFKNSRQS